MFTSPHPQRAGLFIAALISVAIVTGQNYTSIEATEYDPDYDRWLTGNGSNIIAQGVLTGTLSVFSEGNANYGMEVMNGTLYAIFNSSIKGYDLADGSEVMTLTISGAGFLNGMGSDPQTDRLWVSDFANNEIIEVDVSDHDSPSANTVVNNTGATPNGVVYDEIDDRLVFVTWGSNASIRAVDLDSYAVTTLLSPGVGNIDGVDMTSDGRFLISCWSPQRVRMYDHELTEQLDEWTGFSNPADISYAEELGTLGVANSGNQSLSFVQIGAPSSVDFYEQMGLSIYPNPVERGELLSILAHEGMVIEQIQLIDMLGRMSDLTYLLAESSGNELQKLDLGQAVGASGLYRLLVRTRDGQQFDTPLRVE